MQIICSVFYGSVEYCFLPVLEYLVSDINEHNGEQLLYWEREKNAYDRNNRDIIIIITVKYDGF